MKHLLELIFGFFLLGLSTLSWAESEADTCALARDPARCEARQAALAACADMHGTYKRACLEAALPAVDCEKAKNPASCSRAQSAKAAANEACKGKTDLERRDCLKEEKAKAKQSVKKKAVKAKVKAKSKPKSKPKLKSSGPTK